MDFFPQICSRRPHAEWHFYRNGQWELARSQRALSACQKGLEHTEKPRFPEVSCFFLGTCQNLLTDHAVPTTAGHFLHKQHPALVLRSDRPWSGISYLLCIVSKCSWNQRKRLKVWREFYVTRSRQTNPGLSVGPLGGAGPRELAKFKCWGDIHRWTDAVGGMRGVSPQWKFKWGLFCKEDCIQHVPQVQGHSHGP